MTTVLRAPTTIDVPHRPGETVTIQKLNGWKMEKARKTALNAIVGELMARGGAAAQKELIEAFALVDEQNKAAAPPSAVDPLMSYDRRTLIENGLVAVSYDQRPLVELIEDLDDDDIDFYARAILRHTKPALFQTPAEQLEAQKND